MFLDRGRGKAKSVDTQKQTKRGETDVAFRIINHCCSVSQRERKRVREKGEREREREREK